jgi:uncharacterized protein (DUF305 family)
MTTTRTSRALGALALALGLALATSACGTDAPEDTRAAVSATEHNDADVAFATEMIQHHAQALSMVDLTMGRTLEPAVQELTEDIRAAQAPEIEAMTDWLVAWGEDVPETVRDHASAGHGEGAQDMEGMAEVPGMMSAEEMQALADASGADFQRMWLEMMVEHHRGAIEMAEAEQAEGRYAPAVELAEGIVSSQSREIATMEDLLSS